MLTLRLTKQFCVREESDPSRSPSLGLTQGLGWSERPSQLVIQYLWAEAVREKAVWGVGRGREGGGGKGAGGKGGGGEDGGGEDGGGDG